MALNVTNSHADTETSGLKTIYICDGQLIGNDPVPSSVYLLGISFFKFLARIPLCCCASK